MNTWIPCLSTVSLQSEDPARIRRLQAPLGDVDGSRKDPATASCHWVELVPVVFGHGVDWATSRRSVVDYQSETISLSNEQTTQSLSVSLGI